MHSLIAIIADQITQAFYSDAQERDEHGRWTGGGPAAKAAETAKTFEEHNAANDYHNSVGTYHETMRPGPGHDPAGELHRHAADMHYVATQGDPKFERNFLKEPVASYTAARAAQYPDLTFSKNPAEASRIANAATSLVRGKTNPVAASSGAQMAKFLDAIHRDLGRTTTEAGRSVGKALKNPDGLARVTRGRGREPKPN